MRIKVYSILIALFLGIEVCSVTLAGSSVKLSGVQFSLGSFIGEGTVSGLGNTDVIVRMEASGIPRVTCTNQGGGLVPGQNPTQVSATSQAFLPADDQVVKNGKSAFRVVVSPPPTMDPIEAGCPNATWTAHIDFVFWNRATITVSTPSQAVLLSQDYSCVTTADPASVVCGRN